jgi:predicted XRE-type DNA-binding protein
MMCMAQWHVMNLAKSENLKNAAGAESIEVMKPGMSDLVSHK